MESPRAFRSGYRQSTVIKALERASQMSQFETCGESDEYEEGTSNKGSYCEGNAKKLTDAIQKFGNRQPGQLFKEMHEIERHKRFSTFLEPEEDSYDRSDPGPVSRLAINPHFMNVTLLVISFNAIWIGIDSDYNKSTALKDAALVYIVMENFFCFFFTFELVVRFIALKRKIYFYRDRAFVFDLILLILMVLETWIIPLVIEGSGGPKLLMLMRLFRLLRLTRMARLMRFFPELLYQIRAMAAAGRSVSTAVILLLFWTYLMAIIISMFYGKDMKFRKNYGTVLEASYSLIMQGTLLDDCTDAFRALGDGDVGLWIIFTLYVLCSSWMLLNMLLGVMCEVVTITKNTERENAKIEESSKMLTEVFSEIDEDGTGTVSQKEFDQMKEKKKVLEALDILSVEPKHLLALSEALFESDDPHAPGRELSFEEFLEVVSHMRPENVASVLDISQFITSTKKSQRSCMTTVDELCDQIQRLVLNKNNPQSGRDTIRSLELGSLPLDASELFEISELEAQITAKRHKADKAEKTLMEAKQKLRALNDEQ